MLEFAQCMRSHGVPDFPDPSAPGSRPAGGVNTYLGNTFNPNTPTYQAASAACRMYADAKPVTPAVAAQVQAQQLQYAQCMREHGVPGFPDPSSTGGFTIPNSIDQNSTTFHAAENACQSLQPGVNGNLPGSSGS